MLVYDKFWGSSFVYITGREQTSRFVWKSRPIPDVGVSPAYVVSCRAGACRRSLWVALSPSPKTTCVPHNRKRSGGKAKQRQMELFTQSLTYEVLERRLCTQESSSFMETKTDLKPVGHLLLLRQALPPAAF